MSYDLCEYNNSHLGMRRQSQALRLVIKQAINAKPVSQANKPQRSLSRRTLRNSDVASKSKDFFLNMRVAVLNRTRQHWYMRWYSTGSGSDRAPTETHSPKGARSLPLPVLYQCCVA